MDSNSPTSPKGIKPRGFEVWQASSGMYKTYVCAFCKRGFSNAQALGGHMNIHRRDRAKLIKEQAASLDQENLLSLDITASTNPIPSDHSSQVSPGQTNSVIERSEEVSPLLEDELQQLPLFVDDKLGILGNVAGVVKEKKMQPGEDVSSQSKAEVVDLELRLGPDPHEISGTC